MKATLLLFFVLIGTGAFAQGFEERLAPKQAACQKIGFDKLRKLHRSGAVRPTINDKNANSIAAGYLTLVTQDPLVVAEDPIASYINRASVVVNPAKSSLTVDFKEDVPKQRVTVAISYEDGKLLKSESFVPEEREQTVSLPELKATSLYASRYNVAVYQEDKRVLYWGQFIK